MGDAVGCNDGYGDGSLDIVGIDVGKLVGCFDG